MNLQIFPGLKRGLRGRRYFEEVDAHVCMNRVFFGWVGNGETDAFAHTAVALAAKPERNADLIKRVIFRIAVEAVVCGHDEVAPAKPDDVRRPSHGVLVIGIIDLPQDRPEEAVDLRMIDRAGHRDQDAHAVGANILASIKEEDLPILGPSAFFRPNDGKYSR